MRFKAVIFDMDGVLVDSEPIHYRAVNTLLAREGHYLHEEENLRFIGTSFEFTWTELVKQFGLGQPLEHYLAAYDPVILDLLGQPLTPTAGAHDLVDYCAGRGLRLALASSSNRAWVEATLRGLGLAGRFDVVVSGDTVQRGKPDPEIFLLAARQLGVEPAHCLVIEDSPAGMLAGRRAGMAVVGVRTPYTNHLRLDDAHRLVGSLVEFDRDWLEDGKDLWLAGAEMRRRAVADG